MGLGRKPRLFCGSPVWCYGPIHLCSKKGEAARPASAFLIAEGEQSVHRRAGIFILSYTQPAMVMKGITAAHIKENGSESLLPNRRDSTGPGPCRLVLN